MYKFLAAGDLHLRRTAPAMRIDDFLATQDQKLNGILSMAQKRGCASVIFPGDVFDKSDSPHGLVEAAIRTFRAYELQYLFVFGQHDLRYHTSDKQNTPLGVLCTALGEQAHVLTPKNPYRPMQAPANAVFYGCSWGEPLPSEMEEAEYRILVLHRPIFTEKPPWDDPNFLLASELVKKCPANLFISGDTHARFFFEDKKTQKTVVNMGSVMRTTTAQVDHEPAVMMITLKDGHASFTPIKIRIRKDVFDMAQVEAKQAKEERIAAFVTGLQDSFDPELRFIDNLQAMAKDAPAGVQSIISEVLQ